MPRKKTNTGKETHRPLIHIERVFFEKASFKLSTGVLSNIAEYAQYIKHSTGDEPTQDEVVEKGLQRLFETDKGFRQWLQRNGSKDGKAATAEPAFLTARSGGAVAASE